MKTNISLFLFLICISFNSLSQGSTDFDGIQFSIGSSFFHGDAGSGSTRIGLNLGAAYRHMFNKKWSVRPKFNYTTLSGDDAQGTNKERNLSFQNKTLRGELTVIHNFKEYDPGKNQFSGASPFVAFGLGAMTNNPTAIYEGTTYELQELSTEGIAYSRFTFYVPISLGINIHINSKTYIGFEYTFHYVFSDYLDDISGDYINNTKLNGVVSTLADRTNEGGYLPTETSNNKSWSEGSQRGSNNSNDFFSTLSFHMGYSFHKNRGKH